MPEDPEIADEAALLVLAESRGEDDDVALVALDVLDVFDEEGRHVLAIVLAVGVVAVALGEGSVTGGPLLDEIADEGRLLLAESDHSGRGPARGVPKSFQDGHDLGGLIEIRLAVALLGDVILIPPLIITKKEHFTG